MCLHMYVCMCICALLGVLFCEGVDASMCTMLCFDVPGTGACAGACAGAGACACA